MMTEEEFRQAFQDVLEERMDAALADYKEKYGDEPHVFSAEHEAKMRAIFDGFEKKQRRRRFTRRALIAAACIVFVLGLTACTVPQIKNSVAGFFVQVFGDHTEYTDPAVTKECIEEEYGLVPVPEGFEIADTIITETSYLVTYSDIDNNIISLQQVANKSYSEYIDGEHGDFVEEMVNGNPVRIYMSSVGAHGAWIADGYYFSLSYNAPIEQTLFKEWIASIDKL